MWQQRNRQPATGLLQQPKDLTRPVTLYSADRESPLSKKLRYQMDWAENNPAYGRVTRPRVEGGASLSRSITEESITLEK